MPSAVATKSEEKKSKAAAQEDRAFEPQQLQHSGGASAGLPRFLRGGGKGSPQVQAKCAKCQEEEDRRTTPVVQAKCACCGGGSCQHDSQPAGIQSTASQGVADASQPLPHADRIQASFGRHDVSGTRAAVGGPAAEANASMGSLAYTAGDRIGFSREPDVKLAAHEAAHVVQQRSGAKLPGGVGRPGDEYEQQADAAADAVNRGESAEPILDRMTPVGPTGSEPVVQHALQVSAYRQFEPPMEMPPPPPRIGPEGMASPEAARSGARGKGPGQALNPGQSALTVAGQAGPAQAPPSPAPAPNDPQPKNCSPGKFNPHCYDADIDEPEDKDEDDAPPPEPETTKSKEEAHPDLPRPDEHDFCPIELALNALASLLAPPEAAQPAGPATAPGGHAAAPASPQAAAGEKPAEGGEAVSGAGMGSGEVQAKADAAADAPSPIEAAITDAEAGRDVSVSLFENSDTAMQDLAPRISALAAGAHFLPEPAGGPGAELSRSADSRAAEFFSAAAARLNDSLSLAADEVPDNLGAATESITSSIADSVELQKAMVSASVATAREQASAAAQSARSQVNDEYFTTVSTIGKQTTAAIDDLTAAHDETIGGIDETESESLTEVNGLYQATYDAHVALGPTYAQKAEERGQQYAAFYNGRTCKLLHDDGTEKKDSFFAGYLTNRRAKAGADASIETVKGYRKSLAETANDQAAAAMSGRKHDRCGIIATASGTRRRVDDRLKTLVGALRAGQKESVAEAAGTRRKMLASINSGLSSALVALDLLEHAGRQSLDDTGYLQQLAVEQAGYASATAVRESVAQAVGNVESALVNARSVLAESPAPTPEDLDGILGQSKAGLNAGIDTLVGIVDSSAAAASARLENAGAAALGALDSDAQTSFQRVAAQSDAFGTQMGSLAAGAAAALGALRTHYTEQAQKTADAGSEGFAQASTDFGKACQVMLVNIDAGLDASEKGLEKKFKDEIEHLDCAIPQQAAIAASKEQPAWKKIAKIVLIIVIIIVVAAVIGPAVIGAVGAAATGAAGALGASAAAAGVIGGAVGAVVGGAIVGAASSGAMTVVDNWAAGRRLTKGLGQAMLVGAITGAVGSVIGLGVNAGLNAVLQGGRFALSAGAQFAVRAVTNVISDTLQNAAQQLVMAGHIDWEELAKGMAISVVMHGSRRLQALQSRVTAASARGTARAITAVSGETSVAASRAQAFADKHTHEAISDKDAKERLDWTKPVKAPKTPPVEPTSQGAAEQAPPIHETTPPEPTTAAPHEPVAAEPPVKPPAQPEAVAAPKPTEPAAPPVIEEHPSSTAVHESESVNRGAVPDPDAIPEIGPAPEGATRVGIGDHEMYIRRGPNGIEVGMCSGECGPLEIVLDKMQPLVEKSNPELHAELEEIRTAAKDVEQRVKDGKLDRAQMKAEIKKLCTKLRSAAERHPLLKATLEPTGPEPKPSRLRGKTAKETGLTPKQAKMFRDLIETPPEGKTPDDMRYERYRQKYANEGGDPADRLDRLEWQFAKQLADENRTSGRSDEDQARAGLIKYLAGRAIKNNNVVEGEETTFTSEETKENQATRPDSLGNKNAKGKFDLVHEHKRLAGEEKVAYDTEQMRAQRKMLSSDKKGEHYVTLSSDEPNLMGNPPEPRPSKPLADKSQVLFSSKDGITYKWVKSKNPKFVAEGFWKKL